MGFSFRLLDSISMVLCRGNRRLDRRYLFFEIALRIKGIVGK